ncbi:MAG TPA: right-handed parallel beta-helix repeat-containing protein [Thermoanaerobaculia bacterium]|nr:right-handed parallel beta-helix repeat-containing protein [Thermoanaerobaculia bacterium]
MAFLLAGCLLPCPAALGEVWYVDNTAAPGGDGSATAPFQRLAAAEAASAPGDEIHLARGDGTARGYDQGLRLKPNQSLVGNAEGDALPVVSNPGGDAVVLAGDASIEAVEVRDAGGAGVAGAAGGRVELRGMRITGAAGDGVAFQVSGDSVLDLLVEDVVISDSGANGVEVISEGPQSLARLELRRTAVRRSGAMGLLLFAGAGSGYASRLELVVEDNRGAVGHGVFDSGAAGVSVQPNDASQVRGVVSGTTVSGAGGRGIEVLGDDNAETVLLLRDNQVVGTEYEAIFASQQNDGRLHVTLQTNRVEPPRTALHAVELMARQQGLLCVALAGPPAIHAGGLRLRQRDASRVLVEGFTGDGADAASLERFLRSTNAAPGRASAALSTRVEPVDGDTCKRPDDPSGAAGPVGSSRTESDGGTISL